MAKVKAKDRRAAQDEAAEPQAAAPAPKKTVAESAKEWAKAIVVAVAIWLVLRTFLIEAFRIPSASMERTLLVGDWLFVNKAIFGSRVPFTRLRVAAFREPRHNDVVVFLSVEERGLRVVKRLIGMPGDTLRMSNDTVYRNRTPLTEPYAQYTSPEGEASPAEADSMRLRQIPYYVGPDARRYAPTTRRWGPIVVPRDSFWVMGDNRDQSRDSRYWGFLPRYNIVGRPMFVYYSYDARSFRGVPQITAIRWGRLLHRIK